MRLLADKNNLGKIPFADEQIGRNRSNQRVQLENILSVDQLMSNSALVESTFKYGRDVSPIFRASWNFMCVAMGVMTDLGGRKLESKVHHQ